MIDPTSIEQYGVLGGDCFEIMKDIKPNSIDCIVAAPYLSYDAKWSDDRLVEFFSLAKNVLVETGSIILLHEITGPYKDRRDMIPKIAEKLGLVRQHDMTYWHYTKGDYFYRGYNSPANIAYEKPDEQYEVAEDDKSTFILCHAPQLLMDLAASTLHAAWRNNAGPDVRERHRAHIGTAEEAPCVGHRDHSRNRFKSEGKDRQIFGIRAAARLIRSVLAA